MKLCSFNSSRASASLFWSSSIFPPLSEQLELLRGLAIGLGSVVGATVLVTIFIQILAQFEFIPIIGNWAHEVIEIIEKLDNSG